MDIYINQLSSLHEVAFLYFEKAHAREYPGRVEKDDIVVKRYFCPMSDLGAFFWDFAPYGCLEI